jgi:hypothetical protein
MADNYCYAYGKSGHISRDYRLRKAPIADVALIERDQFLGDVVEDSTHITKEETVLLSINDMVFDNGSTIDLIKHAKLLTEITATTNPIVVSGVQTDAVGWEIQGHFTTARLHQQIYYLCRPWSI